MTQQVLVKDRQTRRGHPPQVVNNRQPQIQSLRAIAVLSVILYHFWPNRLSGGYVGVDVFFVISGYLMTKSILHIRADHGGQLGSTMREFYARRIARILPAAVVTLLICAVVVLTALTAVAWNEDLKEILASSLFVENWFLASNATDYLGAGTTSPVQHFWSLSVEEQFYAVWPLLVFFAAKAGPRLTARGRTVRLLACFTTMTVASLLYSIHETTVNSSAAYFNSGTRFWELSFGAMAFVVDRDLRLSAKVRAVFGWAGLALIGYVLVTFAGSTPFPGWHAALPVTGAALVILSSPTSSAWGPRRLLSMRLPQWIGDISYSMYLIHWPLLILLTEAAHGGTDLSTTVKLGLLPTIVVLSWLMKRHVEDRFRRSNASPAKRTRSAHRARRSATSSLRRTVTVIAFVEVAVVLVCLGGLRQHDRMVNQATAPLTAFNQSPSAQATCFAAISAGKPSDACPHTDGSVTSVVPSPLIAKSDWPYGECQERGNSTDGSSCQLQEGTAGLIVVAGDSHITQWLPAILPWAKSHNLSVATFLHSGCPLTASSDWGAPCSAWNTKVASEIKDLKPKYIFTSAESALRGSEMAPKISGLSERWRELSTGGAKIVAFRDIPQPDTAGVGDIPNCLERTQSFDGCSFDVQRGLGHDLVGPAAEQVPNSSTIDLAPVFCPNSRCVPQVNGILVWIDGGHMSSYFARGVAGALAIALNGAVGS